MFSGWELVAIFAVILILFGAKKLPELARGLGQGIKEFKKSSREIQDEIQQSIDLESPPPPPKRTAPPHEATASREEEVPPAEPEAEREPEPVSAGGSSQPSGHPDSKQA